MDSRPRKAASWCPGRDSNPHDRGRGIFCPLRSVARHAATGCSRPILVTRHTVVTGRNETHSGRPDLRVYAPRRSCLSGPQAPGVQTRGSRGLPKSPSTAMAPTGPPETRERGTGVDRQGQQASRRPPRPIRLLSTGPGSLTCFAYSPSGREARPSPSSPPPQRARRAGATTSMLFPAPGNCQRRNDVIDRVRKGSRHAPGVAGFTQSASLTEKNLQ